MKQNLDYPSRKSPTKLDSDGLPVTDKELKVLRASEGKITPGKTNVPAESRQAIIKSLAEGLIEVETKIKESGSVLKDRNICGMITAPKASTSHQPRYAERLPPLCGNPWA